MKHLAGPAILAALLLQPIAGRADDVDLGHVFTVTNGTFTADRHAGGIVGHRAVAQGNEVVGDVTDIVFDETLTVAGYVVDVGGFLGLDATPLFVPDDLASIRIDGSAVELVIGMAAAELTTDARID